MKDFTREATIHAKEGLAKGGIQSKILAFPFNLGSVTVQEMGGIKLRSIHFNFGFFLISLQIITSA